METTTTTGAQLARAIQNIARKGIANKAGHILDAAETMGFVAKIHDDPSDEWYGTIDVQEYNVTEIETSPDIKPGYHEGVFLSAIQDITNGLVIIPKLYSDVVFTFDSVSRREYVRMFSQVDVIKLEGGTTVSVGVIEREPFDVDADDDVNVEDLAETGNKTWTEYTAEKVETVVVDKDGNQVTITTTSKDSTVQVGDNVTIKADQENVDVTVGETQFHMEDGKVTVKTTDVTVNADGDVKVEASGNINAKASGDVKIEASGNADIKASSSKVEASQVQITGGQLTVNGTAAPSGSGPFCGIPVCPFSGAPHVGNMVSGT